MKVGKYECKMLDEEASREDGMGDTSRLPALFCDATGLSHISHLQTHANGMKTLGQIHPQCKFIEFQQVYNGF